MRLLIIDNAAMIQKNGHYLCSMKTGSFALEIKNKGNEVCFLQLSRSSSLTISSFDIIAHGMNELHVNKKKNALFNHLSVLLKFIKVVTRSDFVYFFYPNSLKYLAFLCILIRKPYGFYIRGMVGIESGISKLLYRHARIILTVSPLFTKKVASESPKAITDTIKPMVDITILDIFNKSYSTRPSFFHFTYLGRLDSDKGLFELCDAIIQLREKGIINYHLDIWGNGPVLPKLKLIIEENNLSELISLKGVAQGKDAVLNVYRNSDAYILPTYHEGFPRTLYEAMISGTPIITTMVGGIPGLMKDGFNCIAITPRSSDSIEEAILKLINMNFEDVNNMINHGYETVSPILDGKKPTHAEMLCSYLSKIL